MEEDAKVFDLESISSTYFNVAKAIIHLSPTSMGTNLCLLQTSEFF